MKKRIIATSWHPGGANAILPVIRRLNQEGRADIVTIGHQYSEKIFGKGGIEYKTLGSYNLNDVSVDSMFSLLEKESPNIVFTGTSIQDDKNRDTIEHTLTLAAKGRGIKSLSVLDLWDINCTKRFRDIYSESRELKFLPDKIAILDKLCEESMLKQGFPKEKLVITGNPYFDELIKLKEQFGEEDVHRVKSELGIDLDSYLLFYGASPIEHHYGNEFGYTEKTVLRELLDAVKKLEGRKKISVIVGVHLRANKQDLEQIAEEYKLPVIVSQSYPPRTAILASDAVVSSTSTALVESTYLGKPSISLQPGLKKDDLLITNKLGVTLPVYKHGEIGGVLEKLVFDKNYAAELSERGKTKGFGIDGKATERVTDLVYKMLE